MKISFAKPELPNAGALVVGVLDERRLTSTAAALDRDTEGAVGRALAASRRFKGRGEDLLTVLAPLPRICGSWRNSATWCGTRVFAASA